MYWRYLPKKKNSVCVFFEINAFKKRPQLDIRKAVET